jgi:hypothetical protein
MEKTLTRRAMLNAGAAFVGGSVLSTVGLATASKNASVPWTSVAYARAF